MADNTPENNSDNPTEHQTENPVNAITPTTDTETNNLNQETKNMEVHHSHGLTHKKKWTEYLLEFLMLFLAVFLGFTAENIREHAIERQRAKQYLAVYKNDLLQNKILYHNFDSTYDALLPIYDSIVNIYYEKRENADLQVLARLLLKGKRTINVPFSTAAYSQIVNSGSMRLIEDGVLTDAMNKHNVAIDNFKEFDIQLKAVRSNIYIEVLKLEDIHDFFHYDRKEKTQLRNYVPAMDSFPPLKDEQRRILVGYYKLYTSQTAYLVRVLAELNLQNEDLLNLINKRID